MTGVLNRQGAPRRRRRKEARPAEIMAVALPVFADHGFAAARLEDIAERAGIVKGAIYLYFPTKEELFRAVVRSAIVPHTEALRKAAEDFDQPLAELTHRLLAAAVTALIRPSVIGMARVVIGEARNFPDLARFWHDEVVSPVIDAVANALRRAQERGELRGGDPRLFAFSLIGPMFLAALYRDVFDGIAPDCPGLAKLAEEHSRTVLSGFLASATNPELQTEA